MRAELQPRGPAAALVLTEDDVAALGGGKTPPVRVTVGGQTVRLRVGRMRGEILIGFSRAVREQLGVAPGQELDAIVELDDAPREVEVPEDLAVALHGAGAEEAFAALSFTHRKEWVRSVLDAKRPETRAKRVAAAVAALS